MQSFLQKRIRRRRIETTEENVKNPRDGMHEECIEYADHQKNHPKCPTHNVRCKCTIHTSTVYSNFCLMFYY